MLFFERKFVIFRCGPVAALFSSASCGFDGGPSVRTEGEVTSLDGRDFENASRIELGIVNARLASRNRKMRIANQLVKSQKFSRE